MTEGTLFNSGFLGASFSWWIGQIASDSTWRDNILSGKFESKEQIPGWGRRYKVRIIGLHDQGETEIPSDQLPWAQIMYPVTAGGGQTNAGATANLRQGMFVFGFFLDGQEQQVPVIMGVLGNNAQTQLATKIGDNRVTNTQPGSLATSGYATPSDGNKDPNVKVPDDGLVINKPKTQEQSEECAPAPPGVSVNEFGLRADKPLSSTQFKDQQSALAEADARGLTGTERSNFIQQSVSSGIKARCQEANSPTSPSQPGATKENIDAVHEQSKADVVRNDYYSRKTSLLSPCSETNSAMKAIQITIENLTKDIDKILNAAESYVDAVSNKLEDVQSLIFNASVEIAKYMKTVFKKIMEYTTKQLNKGLSKTVELIPPNMRYMYFDIKTQITELITCIFNKIIDQLAANAQGLLDQQLQKQLPPKDPTVQNPPVQTPVTQICGVEQFVGDMISINMKEIDDGVNGVLDNVNTFLNDVLAELGTITGVPAGAGGFQNPADLIGDVTGSITSALNFENISLNLFGCDLKPNCAASDYYSLQNGSGAAEEPQQPRAAEVDKAAQQPTTPPQTTQTPYAQPSQNQPDIDFGTRDEAVRAVESGTAGFY